MNVWFIARGAGLSALILLTVATALGALGSTRFAPGPRYIVQYLHRVCAGLGLTVLALHIGTILADSFAHVGWRGAIVPFASGYRPTAVAIGSLAAYAFLVAAVLGLARGRMAASRAGARTWRWLHGLAYAGWGAAMIHGFTSGTDTALGWVRAVYILCLAAVAASIIGRLAEPTSLRVQGVLR